MFKRLRWIVVGAGLGATATRLAKRRLRQFLATHSPPEVASRAATNARSEWLEALAEGREAMRRREAELRTEIHRRHRP